MLASVMLTVMGVGLLVSALAMNHVDASWNAPTAWYGVLAVFVVGSGALAWWDAYGFAVFLVMQSGMAGLFQWMFSAALPLPRVAAVLVGSVWALCFAAGFAFIRWTKHSRDPIPDVLRSMFPPTSITEKGGVQVAFRAPATLPSNAIWPIEVVLQNCTGASRTIELALAEAPLWPGKQALVSRPPGAIVLGASEVKRIQFPVCASAQAPARGEVRTYLRVHVSGTRGRRTRRWRAEPLVAPIGLLQIAIAALLFAPLGLVLVIIRRGGLLMQLVSAGPARAPHELPEPSVETLWAPPAAPVLPH
jgi:hypothetical protein